MLGYLPTTIKIAGQNYKIRTDYRDILRIVAAFNDDELTDSEKVYICLKQLYIDFDTIPNEHLETAYKSAMAFLDCNMKGERRGPKLIDWKKDEPLVFPAINKVAGFEVRSVKYMHWWTFMGYFQGIDANDTWGFILTIRQKKAKHKKLEKHEQAFFAANPELCLVDASVKTKENGIKDLEGIYNDLLKGGGS